MIDLNLTEAVAVSGVSLAGIAIGLNRLLSRSRVESSRANGETHVIELMRSELTRMSEVISDQSRRLTQQSEQIAELGTQNRQLLDEVATLHRDLAALREEAARKCGVCKLREEPTTGGNY